MDVMYKLEDESLELCAIARAGWDEDYFEPSRSNARVCQGVFVFTCIEDEDTEYENNTKAFVPGISKAQWNDMLLKAVPKGVLDLTKFKLTFDDNIDGVIQELDNMIAANQAVLECEIGPDMGYFEGILEQ